VAPGLRLSLRHGGSRTWLLTCLLLGVGALVGATLDADVLDWQPIVAWREPWRWWTAAFVHLSGGHLAANLVGLAIVGVFGLAAGCGRREAAAWTVAWPLTHLGLLMRPGLLHYGGLSGVLHAGVVIAALCVLLNEQGRRRWIAAAVLAGLVLKLWSEQPWLATVQHWPGWDIPVAPWAHVCGVAAGLLCALVAWATGRSTTLATMR
jgi:rhomboid family GlyGly-CTERM serine protease